MKDEPSRRNFFNPRAFVGFLIFCAVLGVLIALHSRWIGMAWAFVNLGALLVGSIVLAWRNWAHRGTSQRAYLGQAAALPRSWRKWVLDEDGEKK